MLELFLRKCPIWTPLLNSTFHSQLTIYKEQFLENLFAILRFEADRNVAKLEKPVDKDKWATEPAVVNAFYNPNKNDIGKQTADKKCKQSALLLWCQH